MAGMTKELIIQTVLELLNERPFAKITVKDIVERCGINRNTFYYHFRDITDVMEYAFKREMDRIMQSHMESASDAATPEAAEDLLDGLAQVVDMLRENKRAILHIYRSLDRVILQRQLEQLCDYMVSNYVLRAENVPELRQLSEEDARLVKNLQKCLLEGVLLDWLEHGMKEDLAAGMKRMMQLLRLADEDARGGRISGPDSGWNQE
ncbi:MAG: TetR/AcrR family transcriptional regulator [Lachnospiraceae bacterium]|nr:TetR/AcrR family transcriptional regulator [Lachnospiraceae bacterium]